MSEAIDRLREIPDEVLEELTTIQPANVHWIMNTLGFKMVEKDRRYWQHPALGDTVFYFDLIKDDVSTLMPKLVKLVQDMQLIGMGRGWMVNPANNDRI